MTSLGLAALLIFASGADDPSSAPPPFPKLGKPGETIYFSAVPVQKPKKSKDRIDGGLNHVFLSLWLPEGVDKVRGLYLMPFNLNGVDQQPARALCRHWKFALVGGNFMRVDRAEFSTLLLAGLKDLAVQSNHPEVEHAPLIAASMSAGVGMCVSLAEQLPDRFIACGLACLEVGPETERTSAVPMMSIFGEKDGKQMAQHEELLPRRRTAFASSWAIAVQWGRRHEWGQSNNILFPFFDEVIRQRLPANPDATAGPVKLSPCKTAEAWLGDPATWKQPEAAIAPAAAYKGDPAKACWLPGPRTAHAWQAFVAAKPAFRITIPSPQGDGKPLTVLRPMEALNVTIEANASMPDGAADLFDGETRLTEITVKDRKGTAKVPSLPPGIRVLIARPQARANSPLAGPSHPVVVLMSD